MISSSSSSLFLYALFCCYQSAALSSASSFSWAWLEACFPEMSFGAKTNHLARFLCKCQEIKTGNLLEKQRERSGA